MKRAERNIIIRIVAITLTGMMSILVANKIMFTHVHKLDDGTIITHAHPFNKTSDSQPYKTHNHTISEFLFLSNLVTVFAIVFLALILLVLARRIKNLVFSFQYLRPVCILLNKGRAPPIY